MTPTVRTLIVACALSAAACPETNQNSNAGPDSAVAMDAGRADGSTPDAAADSGANDADSGSATGLSQAEEDSLRYTREEEKLARDVYTQFDHYDSLFGNTASAEQMHMDAVAVLLTRYGVADPAQGKDVGQFDNSDLQALYDRLTQQGSSSLMAALAVGLEIEELDIHDISEARKAIEHADILRVYDNITRGSRNHLRAFYRRLTALGGTYTPQHLDQATFSEIATSPMEQGP